MDITTKQVLFSHHAMIKMVDRGATEDEVIRAIKEGSSEPARRGRLLFRKNFPFNSTWRGRLYSVKQVAPVVAAENDKVVIITVYVYYF
jgi:hypothetical protein